jgi:hypothetical protein
MGFAGGFGTLGGGGGSRGGGFGSSLGGGRAGGGGKAKGLNLKIGGVGAFARKAIASRVGEVRGAKPPKMASSSGRSMFGRSVR